MKKSYDDFLKIMKDMDCADETYHHIHDIVKAPIETDFILRWQWVQAVSAFDKLIHDLVRIGMMEIFQGIRVPTRKYNTFLIDMATYSAMRNDDDPLTAVALRQSIFEQRVVAVNKKFSYQNPNNVADGLSYIWNEEHKWRVIADCVDATEDDCRVQLNNISIRRNQIVHQGDYPDEMSSPQEISCEDVLVVKKFITDLGTAIFKLVKL